MSETSPKKKKNCHWWLVYNFGDAPMKDTESETEDGITDKNINLQRPSNSRTIANSVETGQPNPEAVGTP